jgi:membrane protease subunit (stomatin/prohibitin family)
MPLLGPMGRRGRRRGLVVGAAVGASMANRNNQNAPEEEVQQPVAAAPSTDDQIAELEKLAQLKDQGILTQEEFDAKKKQILGL